MSHVLMANTSLFFRATESRFAHGVDCQHKRLQIILDTIGNMTDSSNKSTDAFYLYSAVRDQGSQWHRSVRCAQKEAGPRNKKNAEFVEFMAMAHYDDVSDITTETVCDTCTDDLLQL